MEPKINPELQIPPALPVGEGLTPEVDIWDPPFERWIRLADDLLGRTPPRLPKGEVISGTEILKH